MVELKKVTKIYDTKKIKYQALSEVDLNVKKGDFCVIQGPSGSGKSTLLNLIGCLDIPTSGTVLVDGIDPSTLNDARQSEFRAKKIGFVFQSFNLIAVFNAWENIVYPFSLIGNKKIPTDYVEYLMKKLGIWDLRKKRPDELSGGQQQRVAIARALIMKPSLVLADEPTANLDSTTGEEMIRYLKSLSDEVGVTVIIATHDPMVIHFSKHIVLLKDGKIKEELWNAKKKLECS